MCWLVVVCGHFTLVVLTPGPDDVDGFETLNLSFPAAEAVILGFQHYIVMLGTSVIIPSALVPQMGGGNVSLPKNHLKSIPISESWLISLVDMCI